MVDGLWICLCLWVCVWWVVVMWSGCVVEIEKEEMGHHFWDMKETHMFEESVGSGGLHLLIFLF